jgi:hypothetical protein
MGARAKGVRVPAREAEAAPHATALDDGTLTQAHSWEFQAHASPFGSRTSPDETTEHSGHDSGGDTRDWAVHTSSQQGVPVLEAADGGVVKPCRATHERLMPSERAQQQEEEEEARTHFEQASRHPARQAADAMVGARRASGALHSGATRPPPPPPPSTRPVLSRRASPAARWRTPPHRECSSGLAGSRA